jgi:hypothetical protein
VIIGESAVKLVIVGHAVQMPEHADAACAPPAQGATQDPRARDREKDSTTLSALLLDCVNYLSAQTHGPMVITAYVPNWCNCITSEIAHGRSMHQRVNYITTSHGELQFHSRLLYSSSRNIFGQE